jgi:hypothetical protein
MIINLAALEGGANRTQRGMGAATKIAAGRISQVESARFGIGGERPIDRHTYGRLDRARRFRERGVANTQPSHPGARQIPSGRVRRDAVETDIDRRAGEARLPGGPDLSEPDLPIVPIHAASPARDGRDDADLISGLERRPKALEKPDVFLADVDIHESAHALVIEQALANARMSAF